MDGTPTSGHGDPTELGPAGAPGEEALLRAARAGERAAVERLYADHLASARRLATILAGSADAEELVAEAFARVLGQLRAGAGPTSSFRAYLNTTIRNLHRDQFRRNREEPASDRPWLLDDSESSVDDFVESLDANGATAALASLPGTWQQVLWHLEVEGRKPAEVAELLSTNAASVSSLAYRAREGLRRAYLDQYAGPTPIDGNCRWTRARLSQYVRDDLSGRAATKVGTHLETCAACSAAHAGMAELNTKLAALLFPVVLVGAMKALDTASAGGATVSSPLFAELTARAAGTPVKDAAAAAHSGSGGHGR
jgi:RNA polymerase sigma factor (sigma-70 family)